jgi:hypothetical protein
MQTQLDEVARALDCHVCGKRSVGNSHIAGPAGTVHLERGDGSRRRHHRCGHLLHDHRQSRPHARAWRRSETAPRWRHQRCGLQCQPGRGIASFSAQLDAYVVAIDAPVGFDPAAGLSTSTSLMDFAADSIGWLELNRSEAASAAESREAFRFRADEAYSNDTGVSSTRKCPCCSSSNSPTRLRRG